MKTPAAPPKSTPTSSLKGRLRTRRSARWVMLAGILLPLAGLLALQLWWLSDYESQSALARRAVLEKYLSFLDEQVEFFYSSNAERSLEFPPEILQQTPEDWAAYLATRFGSKTPKGFRMAFLVGFPDRDPSWKNMVFWDLESHEVTDGPLSAHAAGLYWEMAARRRIGVMSGLVVDERDPSNPLILNPILDGEGGNLIGLAGLIVKVDYFREHMLPELVKKVGLSWERDLVVSIKTPSGEEVLSELPEGDLPFEASRAFSYIFTDWTISMRSGRIDSTKLAWWNFVFNAGLSLSLAVVLLGGIGLALRTASREMHLSQMKADFVSNVSHELRTPLSSIRVFGELMRHGSVRDPEKIQEYGEYIETESRRLSQLIKNILDFSRIESGRRLYHFAPGHLEDIVQSVLKVFKVRLRNSDFEIRYDGPATPLPVLDMDGDALAHAIGNLLDNAVKYSNGARAIAVDLTSSDHEVRLAVTDQGVGISNEEQQRIFDRFHRVSTGLIHEVRGSGLGLAIVQHIVAAHGGHVTVMSAPGRGSTFTIHLPVGVTSPRSGSSPGTGDGSEGRP